MKFYDQVYLLKFNELTPDQMSQVYSLRSAAFVVEQVCVYQDPDDEDENAIHLLICLKGKVIGYGRIIENKEWQIGRIAINQSHRSHGLGRQLVDRAVEYCTNQNAQKQIVMSAQIYLTEFYKTSGFQPEGRMYLEDGIPHIRSVFNTR